MKRWSKLQKALYNIVDPDMCFQIHCSVFKTRSSWYGKGRESVPRFWITINKDIVWDFPCMFLNHETLCRCSHCEAHPSSIRDTYYYIGNYDWITDTIRIYIDLPRASLLTAEFEQDKFGLADILRAVDRRIGNDKRAPYIEKMLEGRYSCTGKENP